MTNARAVFFVLLLILIIPQFSQAQDRISKIDDLLSRYNEYRLFNGSFLVAENGNVLFKKGYGLANMEWNIRNTPDTKFRIGSISKQFTAAVIMQLVEEGKIDLDGKITDYIPGYRKDTGDRITIHQLLNHTSGIMPYTSMANVWSDSLRNHYEQEYFIRHFHSGDLQFEPGTEFAYNNTGYYLLAIIAERVTGKKFGDLLKERILEPLGMNATGSEDDEVVLSRKAYGYLKFGPEYRLDPYFYMPNALGAGHMYSTVEDMVKWDQALYTEKILSNGSKEKMFTPNLGNYGYGWVIVTDTIDGTDEITKVTMHGGGINGFNTIFVRLIDKNQMVAIFNNTGGAPLNEITGEVIKILYDQEFSYPKKPVSDLVAKKISDEGLSAAIESYRDARKNAPEEYDFSENQLNTLGYIYMRNKELDKALAIFELNIEAYPESFNPYDSYAEALMESGDKDGAIKFYKKSIEINPGNTNGIAQLKKLGVEYSEPDMNIDNATLSRYAGKYQLFPDFNITIRIEDTRVFAQATGQAEFELFPSSETKFYYKVVNAQIEFIPEEDGSVNKLILFQNNREIEGVRMD